MLSLLDFTFLSFRPGASLVRGNSFESQLLTGMFYHGLSRQTGAYYYYYYISLSIDFKFLNQFLSSTVLIKFSFILFLSLRIDCLPFNKQVL